MNRESLYITILLTSHAAAVLTGRFDGGDHWCTKQVIIFYLLHIWGDDGGTCTGSDFDTPYGILPASCIDDTPNQAGSTGGCFTGIHTDECSPEPPALCIKLIWITQMIHVMECLLSGRSAVQSNFRLVPFFTKNF
jgi:hypothetical protein